MAGQTKMIIITSNEDIIRQFSLNKAQNTRIIDLNSAKQLVSIGKTDENNMVNLAFLAELSETNSSTDHIYKRALDSPDQNPSKSVKTSRKSTDMICVICNDHAIGFNYDVLSCASCKAFFRRNANQNMDKIRCLTGQGQCSVAHETRRKCQKCRLERCFAAGMRKDFILSDEEKQRRKQRLEENRNLTSLRLSTSESTNSSFLSQSVSNSESLSPTTDDINDLFMDINKVDDSIAFQESQNIEELLFGTLSVEDWVTIQSIQSSFISFFYLPQEQCTNCIDLSDRTSALISWSVFGNKLALRFIDFFRQIDEFQNLLLDDRLILIKYNLLAVFALCKCYNYQYEDDCCSSGMSEQAEKHRRFFSLCNAPDNIRETFANLIIALVQITERNPTLLSLLLIILMLTPGLSMNEEEPPLHDSSAVHQAQCHYTKILWNYLVNQWGETEACRRLIQLLTVILRMQSSANNFRIFFRDQCVRSNAVDKMAPLMQSVLHIS